MPEFIYLYAAVTTIYMFCAVWQNTKLIFQPPRLFIFVANCVIGILGLVSVAGILALAGRALTWWL